MFQTSFSLSRITMCGLVVLCSMITVQAQFRAGIQGTISDSNGALVPEAKIVLKHAETGKIQETQSSEEGFYRIVGLAPGKYSLTVEKTGYKTSLSETVTVAAESVQGLDVILETGEITATVTITDEAVAQLETENASVTKGITPEEVKRLPQVGRDPYELARLTPGIFGNASRSPNGNSGNLPNSVGPGGSNNSIFQTENQPQITANGQRVSANNYQIDGVSVNSLTNGGAAVVTPNQESVKEIHISSTSYLAEDGRNSGAQVKVVSQNGTNDFHGSAIFKYDSPKWNAFNKYPNDFGRGRTERVERFFRQFGGSLGGPLYLPRFGEGGPAVYDGRNRAFFFFSYEGLRENTATPSTVYVETPQFRQSIINARPGGISASILGSSGVQPRITEVLQPSCTDVQGGTPCQVVAGGLDVGSPALGLGQYLTFGNLGGGGLDGIPDIQKVIIATPTTNRPNQYNVRFDFTPSSNDQLTFSTYLTRAFFVGSDAGAGGRPQTDITTKPRNSAATVLYNRTFSATTLNEARFNFTRFAFNEVESSTNTNFGIPRVEVENLLTEGRRIRFGANQAETTPGIFSQTTFEFRDIVNHVRGNHGFRFGGELRRERNDDNLNGASRPLYTFAGLFNFANDAPLFYQINADPQTGGAANAQRHFRSGGYGLFFQDNWKARPNLTLMLGLRYEYYDVLKERDNLVSNFVFGPGGGLAGSRVEPASELYDPDRNNFAPRIGFAWSPKQFDLQDKLVLRGGFGIYYNRIPEILFANTRGNPPFFARFAICCGTAATDFGSPFAGGQIFYTLGTSNSPFSFPANPALAVGIDPATGTPPDRTVEIYGARRDTPIAYVYAYSLDAQYALPYNLTATLGYQGSSSHKLIRLVNQRFINPVIPPGFFASAVFIPTPDVNANFNSMNARLNRRFSRGFQFDAIYRWAKSIDTLSAEGPGAVTNQTFPQDLRQERGPSDFDVRHNFTLSGLWELPIFRNRNDLAGKVLGGWQINGILTSHTGFPWTPHTGQCVRSANSNDFVCPSRPTRYFGGALEDTDNEAFIRPGGNFPGGGLAFFDPNNPGGVLPPGIGRNSFRGPRYFAVDLSVAKRTGMPSFFGEGAFLEVKANFFNAFNNLNLAPFGFFAPNVDNPDFGRAQSALAGRVVELQARFSF
ncbi:MAG TPA: TonB-dependent receptor [Pyrinomonadaceae bacterium]|nr:TonB-dependent receptor [Pyrinomonadaceae bacterium]